MDGAGGSPDDKRGMGLKIENPCAGDTLENGSWPGLWCDWRSRPQVMLLLMALLTTESVVVVGCVPEFINMQPAVVPPE